LNKSSKRPSKFTPFFDVEQAESVNVEDIGRS